MSDRLCAEMPVYNEQDAMKTVLEKWSVESNRIDIDHVIRPYNDGSKGDSLEVMVCAAVTLPYVEVRDKPNGGHGPTILQGRREAVEDGFDWVFQIDSDDEMGPESFVRHWSRREDYDFLVGRREGRKRLLSRRIVSLVSRIVVCCFYGKGNVWDVNTPYRLMRVSALREAFVQIADHTFAPNVILMGMVARSRLRAIEIYVLQNDLKNGSGFNQEMEVVLKWWLKVWFRL